MFTRWLNGLHNKSSIFNCASSIAFDIERVLLNQENAIFFASGGNSPAPVLSALSRMKLDWSRVIVTLSDERLVPADHADSNARMVRSCLLQNKAISATFVPLWLEEDEVTNKALQRLTDRFCRYVRFDVGLIGMGMDGHTASIFSSGFGMVQALNTVDHFVFTNPEPLPLEAPWPRISVSMDVLDKTKYLHLMLFSTEKIALYKKITTNKKDKSPIRRLFDQRNGRISVHT